MSVATTKTGGKRVRRGGRPTREAAEQLRERILEAATDLFLAHGYGATSIEAVARRAQISKRTFYHRFDGKPSLFAAVVHRIIEQLRPPREVTLLDGTDVQDTLTRLAVVILRAALSPQAIALHRLIVAESVRFPNLAAIVAQEGSTEEAVRLIAGLLKRETLGGTLAIDVPTFAARQFLYMVIALPQNRAIAMGQPMSSREIVTWGNDVVNLFLNGCRHWQHKDPRPKGTKKTP